MTHLRINMNTISGRALDNLPIFLCIKIKYFSRGAPFCHSNLYSSSPSWKTNTFSESCLVCKPFLFNENVKQIAKEKKGNMRTDSQCIVAVLGVTQGYVLKYSDIRYTDFFLCNISFAIQVNCCFACVYLHLFNIC